MDSFLSGTIHSSPGSTKMSFLITAGLKLSAWGWIHCPIPETCGRLSRIVADAEARDLLKSLFLPGKTGSVFPKGIPLPRQVQATGAVE